MGWRKGTILILAPSGRDAKIAAAILEEVGVAALVCPDLETLVGGLDRAFGAVIAEEALVRADCRALADFVARQPPWSDYPFLLLGKRGAPAPDALVAALGNVTVLERPFHASTFVNAVRSGLRARHRQLQALAYLQERDRTAERQSLLIRELHHRVRNMLASIQGMLGATARTTGTIEEFTAAFSGRIASLAKTQALLTEDFWQSASLGRILRAELEPFEDVARRTGLDGPEIELGAEIAVPLGMALHELTTNAVKHGCLSVPEGSLSVTWSVRESDPAGDAERALVLEWVERGGPPVRPPERKGFGSIMLERVLAVQCRALIRQDFEPTGLRFRLELPLPATGSERGGALSDAAAVGVQAPPSPLAEPAGIAPP